MGACSYDASLRVCCYNVYMQGMRLFILAAWVIFWVYWFISATQSKRNVGSSFGGYPGMRLLIVLLALFLLRISLKGSGMSQHMLSHNSASEGSLALAIIGTILVVIGLLFSVWARMHIGRNWGMPMSQKQDPELVTSGPYRYVRHPIYSGMLLALLGTALGAGLYWLIILLFIGVYFIFSAYKEEKYLIRQFGKRYKTYMKTSKMLIPFVF